MYSRKPSSSLVRAKAPPAIRARVAAHRQTDNSHTGRRVGQQSTQQGACWHFGWWRSYQLYCSCSPSGTCCWLSCTSNNAAVAALQLAWQLQLLPREPANQQLLQQRQRLCVLRHREALSRAYTHLAEPQPWGPGHLPAQMPQEPSWPWGHQQSWGPACCACLQAHNSSNRATESVHKTARGCASVPLTPSTKTRYFKGQEWVFALLL